MTAPVDLTLFMPALNEELSIRRTVVAAVEAADRLVADGTVATYEVLVVDDGSTDGMPRVLEELSAEFPQLRHERHPVNRGPGAAMRTGFTESRGELVLYTDADLPVDLAVVGEAVRILRRDDADIVAGYRRSRSGEGARRVVYSAVYNALVRVVLGLRVRDVNFALKLVRRRVIDTLDLTSDGIFLDAELLSRADRAGFRIVQMGADYLPRLAGTSTAASWPRIVELGAEARRTVPAILRQPRLRP